MAFKIVLLVSMLAACQAVNYGYNHFEGPFAAPLTTPLAAPLAYHSVSVPTVQRYLHQSAPIVTKVLEQGPAPVYTKVHHEPIVAPVTKTHVSPAPAEYDFGYSLSDPYTANHQNRVESRRGDIVTGSYSLLEADGNKRIVDYIATPLDGFKATVRKEAAIVSPIVQAAPIVRAVW